MHTGSQTSPSDVQKVEAASTSTVGIVSIVLLDQVDADYKFTWLRLKQLGAAQVDNCSIICIS